MVTDETTTPEESQFPPPTFSDPVPEVVLDWHAYYKSFLQEHYDPVEWRGRLLFADGWMYSAFDHAGPEYPPPEDPAELKGLQVAYWRLRREVVQAQAQALQIKLRAVEGLQQGKSLPLPLRYRIPNEVVGATRRLLDDEGNAIIKSLDITAHKERLVALWQDVEDCDNQLKELGVKI